MQKKPRIGIVAPCYNEEENVEELYRRIKAVTAGIDRLVRLIVNTRNFGHIRSPYHGILQGGGIATVYLASDLQDPPELIPEFIRAWEEGYKIVLATKPVVDGAPVFI
jgi:dolichol-phosphate mannosyltransferase